MKQKIFAIAIAYLLLCAPVLSQDNFPRGIFLFRGDSVDFEPLSDSLHLNWVQGQAQNDSGKPMTTLLSNGHGLNVMGYMQENFWQTPTATNQHSYQASSGQDMVFEAELGADSRWNYFVDHPSGFPSGNYIQSTGSAGDMVRYPVPDSEYRYNRTNYVASFVMKIQYPQSGDPYVAELQVVDSATGNIIAYQDLQYHNFSDGNPVTFKLPFSLTYTPPIPPMRMPSTLRGGRPWEPPSVITAKNVDLRVYWPGNVTTYLDKIIVDDSIGLNLNAGNYDTNIATDASLFNSYNLLARAYLVDEPYLSNFTSFNYVQKKIRSSVTNQTNGRGSSITANYQNFDRFLYDGQPNELLVDSYCINATVPPPQ